MYILKLEAAPLQALQLQQRDLMGMLRTEMSHRPTAIGNALYLAIHARHGGFHLRQTLAVGGIEHRTARVKEHLILCTLEGTHLHVRHMPRQTVLQNLARCCLVIVLPIGECHLPGPCVDSCSQSAMEEGKADDAVLAFTHHIATHPLHLEAADSQRVEGDGRQLYCRYLTAHTCGIL